MCKRHYVFILFDQILTKAIQQSIELETIEMNKNLWAMNKNIPLMALDFIWFGAELALIELIAALKFCVSSLFGYDGDVIYMEYNNQRRKKCYK